MSTADYILAGSPAITYRSCEGGELSIPAFAGAVHQHIEQGTDADYNVYSTVFGISSGNPGVNQPNIMDTLLDSNGFSWGISGFVSDDITGMHTLICERRTLITRHRQS